MKTEKGKISDIYELRALPSMSKAQRFRLTTEDGRNVFFHCFNNVELLINRKVGDNVAVEYNEKVNGKFVNNYANNVFTYKSDASKKSTGVTPVYDKEFKDRFGILIDTNIYKKVLEDGDMGTSRFF